MSRALLKARMLRRRIALVGVFAVLFQAILFGWHHHPEHFAAAGEWPALSAVERSAPLSPATVEDECELCAALHHLTAAPVAFTHAALPSLPELPQAPVAQAPLAGAPSLPFHARAPPLA